ncbi:geranylgeranyl pyrophosphate synthase [Puntigrus tetrazona]|uniref:geranylgeranyl pyrophosphate synthase n=1 Tax=Puntigrus tetrazona TaxID=1606681 RepID=UPI001C88FBCB|nr:geranylgeranyl pyrophosphate synthase [Puntigrus tetrazona]XP_043111969.1 geranylgeranyl pyrophosphate synthase [Puntigrus tetrazona]
MDGDERATSERILLEPYKYLLQLPGKQVRTKLSQAFNHWLNVPDDKLQVIIEVTEMLHNASLLIDDIEDSSKLRRGFPVAHSIYGVPSVINSANYVYFLGLEKVLTLEHPEAVHVFTRQLLELHRGQGLDIHWRDTYTCPSEAEYRGMVLQKTGGLFGLAVGLMQLFSLWKRDLKPLLDTLGLFFQIRDDYANLSSTEYSENKSFCEDLTEGKFSFPTIHAIWSRPESTQVQNILRQRTENVDIKRYCVDYLEKVGSFAYTRKTLLDLEAEAYRLIAELGGNPELEALVQHLSRMYKEHEGGALEELGGGASNELGAGLQAGNRKSSGAGLRKSSGAANQSDDFALGTNPTPLQLPSVQSLSFLSRSHFKALQLAHEE